MSTRGEPDFSADGVVGFEADRPTFRATLNLIFEHEQKDGIAGGTRIAAGAFTAAVTYLLATYGIDDGAKVAADYVQQIATKAREQKARADS